MSNYFINCPQTDMFDLVDRLRMKILLRKYVLDLGSWFGNEMEIFAT